MSRLTRPRHDSPPPPIDPRRRKSLFEAIFNGVLQQNLPGPDNSNSQIGAEGDLSAARLPARPLRSPGLLLHLQSGPGSAETPDGECFSRSRRASYARARCRLSGLHPRGRSPRITDVLATWNVVATASSLGNGRLYSKSHRWEPQTDRRQQAVNGAANRVARAD